MGGGRDHLHGVLRGHDLEATSHDTSFLLLLASGLVRLIVSVTNGSPIKAAHVFYRLKFYLLAQNDYFQLQLRLSLKTEEYIYSEQLLENAKEFSNLGLFDSLIVPFEAQYILLQLRSKI